VRRAFLKFVFIKRNLIQKYNSTLETAKICDLQLISEHKYETYKGQPGTCSLTCVGTDETIDVVHAGRQASIDSIGAGWLVALLASFDWPVTATQVSHQLVIMCFLPLELQKIHFF
jgi:hypothetical protein